VFDSADNPQTRIDTAIECLLAAMLLFAPAAFGAVETWSEEIVIALAAAIALCFIAKLIIRPDTRVPWSWTYLPILNFLLLAAAQSIPLPAGLLRAISPNTAATKQRLLSDLPAATDALRTMSLTFYASATLRQLRLLLAVVSVFIVVLNIYRRIEPIRRLLATIAMIGGATAILALLQDATRATKIYWTIETYFG